MGLEFVVVDIVVGIVVIREVSMKVSMVGQVLDWICLFFVYVGDLVCFQFNGNVVERFFMNFVVDFVRSFKN